MEKENLVKSEVKDYDALDLFVNCMYLANTLHEREELWAPLENIRIKKKLKSYQIKLKGLLRDMSKEEIYTIVEKVILLIAELNSTDKILLSDNITLDYDAASKEIQFVYFVNRNKGIYRYLTMSKDKAKYGIMKKSTEITTKEITDKLPDLVYIFLDSLINYVSVINNYVVSEN